MSPLLAQSRHDGVHRTCAAANRLPAIYPYRAYVDAGGFLSYAPNDLDQFRRTATYVDKILKGAKPADLPVQEPVKFELVINLRTAKALPYPRNSSSAPTR
jgi:ABC-type uncharacterized transport system substrate-binding protein